MVRMYKKNIVYIEFSTVHYVRNPLGLKLSLVDDGIGWLLQIFLKGTIKAYKIISSVH